MIVQNYPKGLLSLLASQGGNYPSEMMESLVPTIDVFKLIANAQRSIINSGNLIPDGAVDNIIYPIDLLSVPNGYIRWILSASASLFDVNAPHRSQISGWVIADGAGGARVRSAVTYGTLDWNFSPGYTKLAPYSGLENVILLSGERLGVFASSFAGAASQVNFGIEYLDLKV